MSEAIQNDEFLTKRELARLCRCSERTIDRLLEGGNAPPVTRLSTRRIIFAAADARKWLSDRTLGLGRQPPQSAIAATPSKPIQLQKQKSPKHKGAREPCEMNRDPRRDGVTAGAKTDQITSKPTTGSPRSFQRLARAIAQVSETTDPLAAALAYARAEWPVFPCSPEDKKPLTRFGFKDATTEAKQLCRWSEKWPHAMIGLRTGPEAGVFVLDVDRNAPGGFDGFAALSVLENQYGNLPETLRSVTPRTGSHYYFFWRDGIKNSAGRLGASLDVRGDGGYVILPPSRRADGKGYEWAETSSPVPIEAPQWLLDLLLAPKKPHRHCKQTIGRTAMPPHTHVRRLRANVTVSPRLSQDKETKR